MMTIAHHACLSTGHVTEQVAADLNRIVSGEHMNLWVADRDWQAGITAAPWLEYGWWVRVPDKTADLWAALPECLRACFEIAAGHTIKWILFDCDEPAIDDLPVYDW